MQGSNENLDDRQGRTTQPAQTGSLTGVDLLHPPKKIEDLGDTEKRFLVGAIRESYVQGLNECNRNPGVASRDRNTAYRLADQWIGGSIPFLGDVMGDVNTGSASNR